MTNTAPAVRRPASARRRPHVVVLGGGFGGLAAVRALRRSDVDITLVDRHTYNAFQPLLYQVATAGLNPGDEAAQIEIASKTTNRIAFNARLGTGRPVGSSSRVIGRVMKWAPVRARGTSRGSGARRPTGR